MAMVASKSRLLAVLMLAGVLVPQAQAAATATSEPPTLDAVLSNKNRAAQDSQALSGIARARLDALKEAALGYGVRSGLARRSYEISQVVHENERMLDSIYNFAAMVLDKNVLCPVLLEGEKSLNQTGTDTIRIVDATYRIERQAQFVTAPPNWRDYLMRDFKYTSDMPASSLLPNSEAEQVVWRQGVADGWNVGTEQANQIFDRALARLERDYKGMVLYKSLLAKGMISKPYVAQADLGVTGDGNSININDRVLRITANPQLEVNPAAWKSVVVPK
jgi:defect in organelle trafficking protein DotC